MVTRKKRNIDFTRKWLKYKKVWHNTFFIYFMQFFIKFDFTQKIIIKYEFIPLFYSIWQKYLNSLERKKDYNKYIKKKVLQWLENLVEAGLKETTSKSQWIIINSIKPNSYTFTRRNEKCNVWFFPS